MKLKKYNDALNIEKEGETESALIMLQECIDEQPMDSDAISALANIMADRKDHAKAISLFENALALNPEDVFLKRNYFISLVENGNKEKDFQLAKELEKEFWFLDLELYPKIKNLPKEVVMKLHDII